MVTIEDILQSYNARTNPDVISGEKTQSQVLQEFLTTFDVGTQDGRVTLKEFEDYYIIEPAFAFWTENSYTGGKGGKPVADDFEYKSETNSQRLSPEQLQQFLVSS